MTHGYVNAHCKLPYCVWCWIVIYIITWLSEVPYCFITGTAIIYIYMKNMINIAVHAILNLRCVPLFMNAARMLSNERLERHFTTSGKTTWVECVHLSLVCVLFPHNKIHLTQHNNVVYESVVVWTTGRGYCLCERFRSGRLAAVLA